MARLKDVAELAGVSITTASSILNVKGGSERFSDSCIAKVRNAAEQLGYAVNHHSRSLRTGRSQVLGISLTASRHLKGRLGWYRGEMIAGGLWACGDHDYELLMISEPDQQLSYQRGLEYLHQRKIDGLIIGSAITGNPIENVHDCSDPVALCRYGFDTELPNFIANVDRGAELIFNHLTQLGHRRIAFFCPENMADVPVAMGRFSEVENWHKTEGAKIDGFELDYYPIWTWPLNHGFIEAANKACIKTLELIEAGKHTAILCWSEVIAQGVYKALEMKGLTAPYDLSVACFYDLFARHMIPALTAVNYREAEMAHAAGEFLIAHLIDNSDFSEYKGLETKIEPSLMVRDSTGPAKS